jgi:hypothetical protein
MQTTNFKKNGKNMFEEEIYIRQGTRIFLWKCSALIFPRAVI